jgi:hypothetical protein
VIAAIILAAVCAALGGALWDRHLRLARARRRAASLEAKLWSANAKLSAGGNVAACNRREREAAVRAHTHRQLEEYVRSRRG